MSHVLTARHCAPFGMQGFATRSAGADFIPVDLRIPAPPFSRWVSRRAEPAWRQAMRWSLIGLTASLVAGEVALFLQGL